MKKRNLKSLKLNKKSISTLNFIGGRNNNDTSNTGNHLTANVNDCPNNTLDISCESMGNCQNTYWCNGMTYKNGTTCWTLCYEDCVTLTF